MTLRPKQRCGISLRPRAGREGVFFACHSQAELGTHHSEVFMNQPTDEQIRKRAHQLWELAGQPEGREHEFWYEAERELKTSDSRESTGAINSEEKSDTFLE